MNATLAAAPLGLRETARRLPLFERHRRMVTAQKASAHNLLVAVHCAALAAGEWRSAGQAATEVFDVSDRRYRRMLEAKETVPMFMHKKLVKLAWAFGVEVHAV